MGYQIVKVTLKSAQVLHQHKVLNPKLLMLEENENVSVNDIEKIELENRAKFRKIKISFNLLSN
jgi:hypothetical protein